MGQSRKQREHSRRLASLAMDETELLMVHSLPIDPPTGV